jgi:hypothetical protein
MTNPISDGEGILLNRPQNAARTDEAVAAERKKLLIIYGSFVGVQLVVYLCTYLTVPGFITPFLNHPIARIVISTFFLWEVGLCALHLFLAPISNFGRAATIAVVVLIGIIPNIMLPMLGPACIVILSALGPAILAPFL